MNTYNAPLLEVGCHDDDLTIVVPHHSPKVFYCVLQWTLRRNVLLGVVAVALCGVGVWEGGGGEFYSTSWTLQQTYSDVVGIDIVRVGPSKL